MAEKSFKPKPLIDAAQITEFGGVEDLEQFKNEGPGQFSYLYVPGFSDQRYQRDTDLSALHRGDIKGKEVRTLDCNLRWFRTTKGSGSDPDNSRVVHAKFQGYEPVTEKDLGSPWMQSMPTGGMVAPDGTIKTAAGDLALFKCTKEVAARNAMRKKIRTEESVDGMEFAEGGLGTVGKHHPDAAPYVSKTIGTQPREANQ